MTILEEQEFEILERINKDYEKNPMTVSQVQKLIYQVIGTGWSVPYERMRHKSLIEFDADLKCKVTDLGWKTYKFYKEQRNKARRSDTFSIANLIISTLTLIVTFFLLNWKSC